VQKLRKKITCKNYVKKLRAKNYVKKITEKIVYNCFMFFVPYYIRYKPYIIGTKHANGTKNAFYTILYKVYNSLKKNIQNTRRTQESVAGGDSGVNLSLRTEQRKEAELRG